jgi:hypothetical protein
VYGHEIGYLKKPESEALGKRNDPRQLGIAEISIIQPLPEPVHGEEKLEGIEEPGRPPLFQRNKMSSFLIRFLISKVIDIPIPVAQHPVQEIIIEDLHTPDHMRIQGAQYIQCRSISFSG